MNELPRIKRECIETHLANTLLHVILFKTFQSEIVNELPRIKGEGIGTHLANTLLHVFDKDIGHIFMPKLLS